MAIQREVTVATGGALAVEEGVAQELRRNLNRARGQGTALGNKVWEVVLNESSFCLNHLCIRNAWNGA